MIQPILAALGYYSAAVAILQTPPSLLPEKPVWFVAIVLFVWGSVKLIDAISRLMERAKQRRATEERRVPALDEESLRRKITEQLELSGTVGDIDIACEQILAKIDAQETAISAIAAILELTRQQGELVEGVLDAVARRLEDLHRVAATNGEFLRSGAVASESLVLRSAGKTRHDIAQLINIHVLRRELDPSYPETMTREELP